MRLLFINQYYFPDLASTGQLLTQLCESLSQQFEIEVLTSFPSYSVKERVRRSLVARQRRHGVAITRVFSTRFGRRFLPLRILNYLTYFLCSAVVGLLTRRADLVVAQTDPPVIGLIALLISKVRGGRFCLVCQDVFPEVAVALGELNPPTIWLLRRVRRLLLRNADTIVAISEGMRQELVRLGADEQKTHVIANWIDTDLVKPVDRQNEFRAQHAVDDPFIVMHSGNIGLSQDFDVILEAAQRLRHETRILFLIVGDGARRPWLEEKIRSEGLQQVRCLDYQPLETLRFSLGAADVHLVTLKAGLEDAIVPSKIYGILAAKRPCISSLPFSSEVANIIKKFDCGVVCQPGDSGALAKAILQLRDDPAAARSMGERGRKAVCENFSRVISAKHYGRLFKVLLEPVEETK